MKIKLTLPEFLRIGTSAAVWILLALMGIAFVVAMVRYAFGIGAISDLSYSYPWGFWISFDLFTGVAISSGGFLMAGHGLHSAHQRIQAPAAPLGADRLPRLHDGCHCPAG